MENTPTPNKQRAAIFNLLGIAAPIVGAGIGSATCQNDFGDFMNVMGCIFYGLIAGSILAVISLIRNERLRALSWSVLLVEAIPAIYFLSLYL
jgi:hypothetical protein